MIVWATGPDGYGRRICTSVVASDVSGGPTHILGASTGADSYGYPAISGRKVVWLHHRGVNTGNAEQYAKTPYDVVGAEITNPAKPVYFTIAGQAGHGLPYPYEWSREAYESPLDISGNLVVWEADGDIYGADISDLDQIKVFPICTAPEDPKRSVDLRPQGRLDRRAQRCGRHLRRGPLRSEPRSRVRGVCRPRQADAAGHRWGHGRVRRRQQPGLPEDVLPHEGIRSGPVPIPDENVLRRRSRAQRLDADLARLQPAPGSDAGFRLQHGEGSGREHGHGQALRLHPACDRRRPSRTT